MRTGGATIVSFLSPGNATGRTSTVANVAWILASNGKRVLAVDWCARTPRVHEYLRPFHLDEAPAAEVLGSALAAVVSPPPARERPARERPDPRPGVLYQYALPGTDRRFAMVGTADDWSPTPGEMGGAVELRGLLRAAPYDYVLIDAPSDISPETLAHTALLCDAAVVCFTPRALVIRESAMIAESLRDGAIGGIRIAAVPRIDGGPRRGQVPSSVGRMFGDYLRDAPEASEVELIEVPTSVYDTFDDVLAVLADEPGDESSLLTAYERLAGWITRGVVTAAVPVSEAVRRRYRRGVRLEPDEATETVLVVYAPEDRPWADWVRGQMRLAGAEVRSLSQTGETADPSGGGTAPTVVAILSPRFTELTGGAVPPFLAHAAGDRPGSVETVGVLVAGDPPAGADRLDRVIDLRGAAPLRARSWLLAPFGLIAAAQPDGAQSAAPRFPASPGGRTTLRVPPRSPAFIGRNGYLEALRDHLTAHPGRPVTLTGGAGVGKSEIARELAHRFAYDYDVVWWVPAQDRESVRASLADLGDALGVGESGSVAEAALAALASPDRPYARWLLIYDNADEPDVLTGLLPGGGQGHVVITSREADAPGLPSPIEVAAFRGEESVALLRRRVTGIAVDDARTVAAALDHLPLALRLAISWMRQNVHLLQQRGTPRPDAVRQCVVELLARLERRSPGMPGEPIRGSHTSSVAVALDITVGTLRQQRLGRSAIHLAEMTAYLSPEGVALRLLRSVPMLTQLAAASDTDALDMLVDAAEIDEVLLLGARFGLFEVDWGRRATVRMHRAVQVLIREGIPESVREVRHEQVLRGLAGYAPPDPDADNEGVRHLFDELQNHLLSSGALRSRSREVRHWVVKQIRYLFQSNDGGTWRSGLAIAQEAIKGWAVGETDALDPLYMRLLVQTANLYRALGQYREAFALNDRVLREQRRVLGVRNVRTLLTGRGRGGDLRGLGRFAEAVVEDQATYEGFVATLGADHPDTLVAAHNLAVSFFLAGDAREALRVASQERARRMRLFGPQDPRTWWSACDAGTFQRELGDYEGSLRTLREALTRIRELRPPNDLDELRINRSLAVTERRLDQVSAAKERNAETLRAYRELLGDDHPFTRGIALSLAADYWRGGDPALAVQQSLRCLRAYERRLDEGHPFTAVCRVNLAAFQRAAGEFDQAVATGAKGLAGLRAELRDAHPWTLAASTNQAGHLAARGDLAEAEALQETAHRRCVQYLGRAHPYTHDAARNLAAIRAGATGLTSTDIDIPQT